MSKVICDVCGTSYPDTAEQCPICGYVCASARQNESGETGEKTESGSGYTYVKGGRFSKNNVRKRNGGAVPVKRQSSQNKRPAPKKRSDSNKGLIITAAILALAIVAVVVFITLRYFVLPENEAKQSSGGSAAVAPSDNEKKEIACSGITTDLVDNRIELKKKGASADINVTIEPADCTDQEITFENNNPSAVNVKVNGKTVTVTALANGNAEIKLICGDQECVVSVCCKFDPELTLTASEIKLTYVGEKISIYPDNIRRDEISWSVDPDNIVTVSNGEVIAVSEGEAKITATYKGQTAVCTVICEFADNDSGSDNAGNSNQNNNDNSGSFDPVVNGTGGGVSE